MVGTYFIQFKVIFNEIGGYNINVFVCRKKNISKT